MKKSDEYQHGIAAGLFFRLAHFGKDSDKHRHGLSAATRRHGLPVGATHFSLNATAPSFIAREVIC